MKVRLTESQLKWYIVEAIKGVLSESFQSDKLRNWFNQHGGVYNRYTGDEWDFMVDKRVRQDGLGDITDGDIVSMKEFGDEKSAREYCYDRNHPKDDYNYGRREPFNNKVYYTVYMAKDGSCLAVGIDREKVPMGVTWGADVTKKTADRIWNNGWNHKTRSNRYVDDSDTYYYGNKGQYFGLHTNQNYYGKKSDNERNRERMSDEQWKEYQEKRKKDIRDKRNSRF